MSRQIHLVTTAIVPMLIAVLAVWLEPTVAAWASGRLSVLPLAVFLLLASLLHPYIRQLMVIALCYGVALLALHDTFRVKQLVLPPGMDNDLWDTARPVVLLLVAVLSATAAVGETLRPGRVWIRRCYFGAAGIYFTGVGFLNYAWTHSWQGAVLCVTGIMALLGCVFADRVVASESEDEAEPEVSDEAIQQLTEAAHRRALEAKEWHDPAQKT